MSLINATIANSTTLDLSLLGVTTSPQVQTIVTLVFALAITVERFMQILLNLYSASEPLLEKYMTAQTLSILAKYNFIIKESVTIPLGISIACIIMLISNQTDSYKKTGLTIAESYAIAIFAGVLAPYVHQLIQIGVKIQKSDGVVLPSLLTRSSLQNSTSQNPSPQNFALHNFTTEKDLEQN